MKIVLPDVASWLLSDRLPTRNLGRSRDALLLKAEILLSGARNILDSDPRKRDMAETAPLVNIVANISKLSF